MIEDVQREDGEQVGRIRYVGEDRWVPETVFGAPLGSAADREAATESCLREGMAALAEPWLRGDDARVWLLEVGPERIVVSSRDPRYGALPEVLDPRAVTLRRER